MIKKHLLSLLFIFNILITSSINAQTPPDKPLTPQEWVDGMRIGSWWIFEIPPKKKNNILVSYYPQILDSLKSLGINGGRLHWQARDAFDENNMLLKEPMDSLEKIVDAFMERDMYICLNVSFLGTHVDEQTKQRHYNGWRQLSKRFKGKSHRLAMSPVIEFHGWEDMGYSRTVMQDSLNWLYDTLTVIYREDNPTRIMSYKPWGASKNAEFETLSFPFGNDPDSKTEKDFYYVASMSGAYGMGDWSTWRPDMPKDELEKLKASTLNGGKGPKKVLGLNKAIQFRQETNIPFWLDHWEANFWKKSSVQEKAKKDKSRELKQKKKKSGKSKPDKPKKEKKQKKRRHNKKKGNKSKGDKKPKEVWSIDQNVAYIKYFNEILEEIGSAGAGMQTRRFWDNKKKDLIRPSKNNTESEKMFIEMMKLYRSQVEEQTHPIGTKK